MANVLNILLWVPPIYLACATSSGSTSGHLYQSFTGVDLDDSQTTSMDLVISKGGCVNYCLLKSCRSMSYNILNSVCKLSDHILNVAQSDPTGNPHISYIHLDPVTTTPSWKLAFRATKGINKSVYQAWNQEGDYDDDPASNAPVGCTSMDGRDSCDRHYRSKILYDWQNIQEATFSLYTDGTQVFSITFNATGAMNRSHVFNMSRIIQSTCSELVNYQGEYNYDSVQGNDYCNRRFYLNTFWLACELDSGWMLISDHNTHCCSYEIYTSYPRFLYTKIDSNSAFSSPNMDEADVFAVHLKGVFT